MKFYSWTLTALLASTLALVAGAADKAPALAIHQDSRLAKLKDLNDYFPMIVPATKSEWEKRKLELREQILVATGLWPMPPKLPLQAVIHDKIDRDGYTIEKVFFASYPGHYVSGNLYRPKGKTGKLPAVLTPHGHWKDGRFYDAGEKEAAIQIQSGAEKTAMSARFPLQARCAQLARLGCVVFHYDMVGVADSQPIAHSTGFTDVAAELRLQSFMGLQTFNSVRALDFLSSLPDVDPKRIGVTGASGGGTQTFILCAIDDRPAAAFPAVMVSTAMQGGCICENCSYLRVNTGNIEIAGVFAPKPLGMSGANDWTVDIERKGLPELKALYRLYGAEDKIMAKCFPQFPHNYNQVSRQLMYSWFNKNLGLGQPEPILEKPFEPVPMRYNFPRHELSVFDDQHPRPADAADAQKLRKSMSQASDQQLSALHPKDTESLGQFRHVVGTALRVMMNDVLPANDAVDAQINADEMQAGIHLKRLFLGRKGSGERIPALMLAPANANGTVVVWIHPHGMASLLQDGKLTGTARQVLQHQAIIIAPDVYLTGGFGGSPGQVNGRYAGFTFGYNRSMLANRVHDVLTAVAFARGLSNDKKIMLAGFEKAGPWVLLASALSGTAVARTAADLDQFAFDRVQKTSDEMMLPGAVKYGGLPAFTALSAPRELYLYNELQPHSSTLVQDAYRAAGSVDRLVQLPAKATPEQVITWLLR